MSNFDDDDIFSNISIKSNKKSSQSQSKSKTVLSFDDDNDTTNDDSFSSFSFNTTTTNSTNNLNDVTDDFTIKKKKKKTTQFILEDDTINPTSTLESTNKVPLHTQSDPNQSKQQSNPQPPTNQPLLNQNSSNQSTTTSTNIPTTQPTTTDTSTTNTTSNTSTTNTTSNTSATNRNVNTSSMFDGSLNITTPNASSMFDGSFQSGPTLSGQANLLKTSNYRGKGNNNNHNNNNNNNRNGYNNHGGYNNSNNDDDRNNNNNRYNNNNRQRHNNNQPQNQHDKNNTNESNQPLLPPPHPTQSQIDFIPSSRIETNKFNSKQKQSNRQFNRDYYSMDENSIVTDTSDYLVPSNTDDTTYQSYPPHQSNSNPLNPIPTTISQRKATQDARKQQRQTDADGWIEERLAYAQDRTIHRDLELIRTNVVENTIFVYPDESVPKFLSKYQNNDEKQHNNDNNNELNTNSLSMFKQAKVQVCQKEAGNMMKLAKDGNASLLEYKRDKQRLKDTNRFWEAKGNTIGAITGANNLVTKEDEERMLEMLEQQKNEIGGYCGNEEWIKRQLLLDEVLFRDQYRKEKELMLKKLNMNVKKEMNNTTVEQNENEIKIENNNSNDENDLKKSTDINPLLPITTPTTTTTSLSHTTSIDSDETLTYDQKQALKRLEIQQIRDNLPAFKARAEFLDLIRENQVVIVVGETGSGKTTQLAQYLYESGYSTVPPTPDGYSWTPNAQMLLENDDEHDNQQNGIQITDSNNINNTTDTKSNSHQLDETTRYLLKTSQRIAVTQPRRVAATSVATRVAEEMDVELGTTVGYAIRFEECCSPYTAIKFMTDGILLRETLSFPTLSQYSCIIMDEAHERSLNTDILFGLLRNILSKRTDLKLIVTSATMNADAFSKFFGGAPIMHISGRTFPVDVNFAAGMPADYILAAAKKVLECHINHVESRLTQTIDLTTNTIITRPQLQPTGDILVFMTGQDDIEATCYYIRQELEKSNVGLPLWILPITSTLPQDVQQRIFSPSTIRKCIVATNIAETSLTIDGIRYVIDSGLYKLKTYNPQLGMDMLTVTPISQASANQRKGRAGRTSSGICYRLFRSEEFLNELLPNNIAEIHRTNLSNVILTLKAIFIGNIFDFKFLERPSSSAILSALYQLYLLGAIDENERITSIGSLMTLLPLDPPISRMLIESIRLQCLSEMITLAAMLTVPNIYYRPHGQDQQYKPIHEKFAMGEGDFITLINIYNSWAYYGYNEHWCEENYFQYKALTKSREIRTQLVGLISSKEFITKVIECFTTINERDDALLLAKQQLINMNKNNNNNYNNNKMKRNFQFNNYNQQQEPISTIHKLPQEQQQQQQHEQQQQQQTQIYKKLPSLQQLQYDNISAYQTYQLLLQNTKRILTSTTTTKQWENIRRCICSGYFINAAKVLNGTTYQNIRTGIHCELHSTSTLGFGNDFVVYQDVVVTTKSYMRMVSSIEPQWLSEYGHLLYKIRMSKKLNDKATHSLAVF